MSVSLTYFPRLRDAGGQRVSTTWPKLLERLSVARVVADKHATPGISLVTYRGDRRSLANVERCYAVGLDLDHLDAVSIFVRREAGQIVGALDWPTLVRRFATTDSFLHTTWSATEASPRARVFLRLSRAVDALEYRRIYAAVAGEAEAGGLVVDRQASDPSRLWFLPSIPPGGTFRHAIGVGAPVNVDGALARVRADEPAPAPRPTAPSSSSPRTGDDVEARAAAYLERCAPAISGSGGHNTTFVVAQRLVRGFALDEATALRLMRVWNDRCQPPWTEHQLRRKLREAADRGTMPLGSLRDADRRAS